MSFFEFNNHLMHNMVVHSLAESQNISIEEAKRLISGLSFSEYHKLSEAGIVPPSGNPIGPTGSTGPSSAPAAQPGTQTTKPSWPGKGSPVEVGMTVGLKGPNGLPVPGTISQVDMSAKGVKVKNPTTGQDEWTNIDTLEPFMAQSGNTAQMQEGFSNTYNVGDIVETPLGTGSISSVSSDVNISGKVMVKLSDPSQAGEDGKYKDTFMFTTDQLTRLQENKELRRLRELAGIKENCSSGATGAGAIAMAPAAMGKVRRRQETTEQAPVEYTPKEPPKTIVGDTKPNQASGKLSADLAVRGKKTASRINNGRKR